jgi:hypothetical protein
VPVVTSSYFHAGWATPYGKYGLNVETPGIFRLILKHILLKERPWYWAADQKDGLGRQLRVRTLIDGNGANIPGLKSDSFTSLQQQARDARRGLWGPGMCAYARPADRRAASVRPTGIVGQLQPSLPWSLHTASAARPGLPADPSPTLPSAAA